MPEYGQMLPVGHALHVMLRAAPMEGEYVARGQDSRALVEVLQLEPPYSAYEHAGAPAHTDVVPLRA